MSDTLPPPVPYRIDYLPHAIQRATSLMAEATRNGDRALFARILADLEYRLRWYPQFGQPLKDLRHAGAQVWLGDVSGLIVRYAVYPNEKAVLVLDLPRWLRGATGPQNEEAGA